MRPAHGSPTGGEAFGLPTSQGAAERVAVRGDRAALRLCLRTFVVAGFAGAAWLLCASAAQAGQAPGDRPIELSAVDLIAADAATTPVPNAVTPASQPVLGLVPELLPAAGSAATSVVLPGATAAQAIPIAPLVDAAGAAGAGGGGSLTSTDPGRSASNGAGLHDPSGQADAAAATPGAAGRAGAGTPSLLTSLTGLLDREVFDREVLDRAGLSRAVLDRVGLPRAVSLVTTALPGSPVSPESPVSPVSLGLPGWVVTPGSLALSGSPARPAVPALRPETGDEADSGVTSPAMLGPAARMVTAAPVNVDRTVPAIAARATFVTRATAPPPTAPAAVEDPGVALPAALWGTNDVPFRPAPAPMRGWVAAGPSTSASIASPDAGAYAVVDVSAATGPAAHRRPAAPAGVASPGQDAQAPTVSPD